MRKTCLAKKNPYDLMVNALKSACAHHPAEYLAKLKIAVTDARGQIGAIAHMLYPADPLTEPELVGLTYYQVGLLKQAAMMGIGSLDAMEFFTDRLIGKPAQVNLNLNATQSYSDFLKEIAVAEGDVIDVTAENELGL
jgi:hypothetical protein